jgi:hypothetical protein
MDKPHKIKWIKDGFSHYRSNDGRWMIERHEFDIPYTCVRWDLYDGHRKIFRYDTLRDAKQDAQETVIDEIGVTISE